MAHDRAALSCSSRRPGSGQPPLVAWLLAAAMVLAIGLKSHPHWLGVPWHWLALARAGGLMLARLDPDSTWWKTGVLLAYLVICCISRASTATPPMVISSSWW